MKVDANPKILETLENHALNSVSVNNQRLTEGSDKVLMTPYLEEKSDSDLETDVNQILESRMSDLNDDIMEIENENFSKFGPRSIAVPWKERKSSFYAYFAHDEAEVKFDFRNEGGALRPLDISNASKYLISDSNSGLPYMRRKGHVLKSESPQDVWYDHNIYPCVIFTRTQEQKKTRNVWGYPMSDTLEETRFFQPWLAKEKLLTWRAALSGPDAVDKAVTDLLRSDDYDMIYGVDFTAYDASVRPEHIIQAFSHIAMRFQNAYIGDLESLCSRFLTIPALCPDGEVSGTHGVPSGSTWTNSVDSLVQFNVSGQYPTRCQIQGDDGIYAIKSSERDLIERNFDDAGLTLNTGKARVYPRSAFYLQRYFSLDYATDGVARGIYSIARAMNRIKYLERWTDFEKMGLTGSDFFSLRTIMILENCKHHPCFKEFVRYVYDLEGKGLNYSRGGLQAYSKSLKSKAQAGVFNQYGESLGFDGFETVKLLKTF